jgi:DNA mismatch repair protein MutS
VAKLAGVPENVLKRAAEIVDKLSNNDIAKRTKEISVETQSPEYDYGMEQQTAKVKKTHKKEKTSDLEMGQISLFDTCNENIKTDDIILELHDLDLSATTPIDAMNILYKMQMKLRERL